MLKSCNISLILIMSTLLTSNAASLWKSNFKEEEKENNPYEMKRRLQQFLFPPKNLNNEVAQRNFPQPNHSNPDIFKQINKWLTNEKNMEMAKRRKRSNENEKLLFVIPFEDEQRNVRSLMYPDDRFRLDLARTDIPWDVPSSVLLDDGIRKIYLDMVTTTPEKRKKSEVYIPLSEEETTRNAIPSEAKFLFDARQLFAESNISNITNSRYNDTTNVSVTEKPPICLNLHISNVIPPELVDRVRILNTSKIDSSGNIGLNVVLFYENLCTTTLKAVTTRSSIQTTSCRTANTFTTPTTTTPCTTKLTPNLVNLSSQDISQLLEAARKDNLNTINKWMNKTLLPFNNGNKKEKFPFKFLNNLNKVNDESEMYKSTYKLNPLNNNNDTLDSPIAIKHLAPTELLFNPIRTEKPPQLSYNQKLLEEALSTGYQQIGNSSISNHDVNATLALKTLLGLIQLIQANNNVHNFQDIP